MKRRKREIPEISTTSLPDIIFMLLFFFMVVTVLRKESPKVKFDIPIVNESVKIESSKKAAFLYIGRDEKGDVIFQLNNSIVPLSRLESKMNGLLNRSDVDQESFEITMKADKEIQMLYIRKAKLAMRKAGIRKLNYITDPEKISNI